MFSSLLNYREFMFHPLAAPFELPLNFQQTFSKFKNCIRPGSPTLIVGILLRQLVLQHYHFNWTFFVWFWLSVFVRDCIYFCPWYSWTISRYNTVYIQLQLYLSVVCRVHRCCWLYRNVFNVKEGVITQILHFLRNYPHRLRMMETFWLRPIIHTCVSDVHASWWCTK